MNFKKSILCAAAAVIVTVCLTLSAVAQQGVINTIVGGGPSNMPATDANLNFPSALAIDAQGNYYTVSEGNLQVLKVNPSTGTLTLVAGNGISGFSGDGGPAVNAELSNPAGLAVDGANPANVYIADLNNCAIRVVNQGTGIITTLNAPQTCTGGDSGPASLAGIEPLALAFNPLNSDLYVFDLAGNGFMRIRKIAGGVPAGTISTVAGGAIGNCGGAAPFGDGGPATGANVGFCYNYGNSDMGIALDTSVSPPNILISDAGHCAVREVIGSTQKIFRVAGSYTLGCGFKDKVTATSAQLYEPAQLQVQISGGTETVTVADAFNDNIRQFAVTITGGIPSSGTITSIAGNNCSGFSGDGGLATAACMSLPEGVVFDASGDLFIGDTDNERVREVNQSTQIINTVAGYSLSNTTVGEVSFDNPVNNPNIPGLGVALYDPAGVYVNPATNNVLIAGNNDHTVHEFLVGTAVVDTVAGNGIAGFAGDGNQGTDPGTELYYPQGVVQDSNGNTYIADTDNCVIRIVNPAGVINDFAGGSAGVQNGCGYLGDGGPATLAQLYEPEGLAVDSSNNLYIADTYNQVIREVNASTGNITTIAGNNLLSAGYSGDGGLATNAMLNYPPGVAVDGANPANVYIADESNQRIRRVDGVTHVITTVAGNGAYGFSGDGPATQNKVYNPQGVASDVNGNIFISDTSNQILRWVDPGGTMLTFAGTYNIGCTFTGDGGPALLAGVCNPVGISVDASGNIYFADQQDNRIRKVNAFAGIGRSTGSLNFGLEAVGTTATPQEVILSAIGPTTINNITTSGDFSEVDDCPNSLTAGATCEVDVYFAPTASGERAGLLTISDNGLLSHTQTVSLEGLGTALSEKGSLAFGSQIVNTQSAAKIATITNSGTTTINLTSITLTDTTDYSVVGSGTTPCPLGAGTLLSKKNCTVSVTFTPKSIGPKKATLVVRSSDPGSPLLVAVSGTGSSFVSVTPNPASFKAQLEGTTSSKAVTVTVKNTGTATVTGISVGAPSNSDFTVATGTTCGSTITSLAGNTSCIINVLFSPKTSDMAGTITGTIDISDSDPSSPQVLQLSGIAVEALVPTTLAFGNVSHTGTKTLNLLVTNVSTVSSLSIAASISGTNAGLFTIVAPTSGTPCTSSLVAASNCTIGVQFTPGTVGTGFTANLTINTGSTNGGTNPVVKLTGNGT
jgi:trimeric autotransporter adhesin